jgi:hypothetical protein
MKIAVVGDQYAFFSQYGFIQFEALFAQELGELWLSAETALSERKKNDYSSSNIKDETLLYGRDLAITSKDFQHRLFSSRVCQVAAQLLKKKSLRYAFDQLWRVPISPCGDGPVGENFCVTPLSLVALLSFDNIDHKRASSPKPFELVFDDLPSKQGDVLFLRPDVLWKVRFPQEAKGRTFFFLGFADEQLAYSYQLRDPHVHSLKQFGYIYGERLLETTHPFVVR